MTSQLRHHYVLSCSVTFFYNFSVTRYVRMIHAKNSEKLPKFVKVTAKILSVLFSGHGVLAGHVQLSYSINAVP